MWKSLTSMHQNNNLSKPTGRVRLLLVLMFVSTVIWIAFAKLAVPPIIKSAYHGKSLSFLNSMIQGQQIHSVEDYLQNWDGIATAILMSLLGFWVLALITSSPGFFRRFVGEATPGSLGAIRMWICTILLLSGRRSEV